MVLSLPVDLLPHFITPLQNDKKTLYNCLLVSRIWCRMVVPYLYRDPFALVSNKNNNERNKVLFLTYYNCLPQKVRTYLTSQGVHIPIEDEVKPVFRYPEYLENLPNSKLLMSVQSWFGPRNFSMSSRFLQALVFKAMVEMFALEAQRLRGLLLHGIFWNLPIDTLSLNTAIVRLSEHQQQLYEFKVSFKSTLISTEKVIRNGRESVNIIRVQKHLRKLMVEHGGDEWMEKMLVAMKSSACTETCMVIKFIDCSFERSYSMTPEYFYGFEKLEKVEFVNCDGLSDELLTGLPGDVRIDMETRTINFVPDLSVGRCSGEFQF